MSVSPTKEEVNEWWNLGRCLGELLRIATLLESGDRRGNPKFINKKDAAAWIRRVVEQLQKGGGL